MEARQSLVTYLEELKADRSFMERVTYMKTMEATVGRYARFPKEMPERLRQALERRGITSLYRHQELAFRTVQSGASTVIVTRPHLGKPTASICRFCLIS